MPQLDLNITILVVATVLKIATRTVSSPFLNPLPGTRSAAVQLYLLVMHGSTMAVVFCLTFYFCTRRGLAGNNQEWTLKINGHPIAR